MLLIQRKDPPPHLQPEQQRLKVRAGSRCGVKPACAQECSSSGVMQLDSLSATVRKVSSAKSASAGCSMRSSDARFGV